MSDLQQQIEKYKINFHWCNMMGTMQVDAEIRAGFHNYDMQFISRSASHTNVADAVEDVIKQYKADLKEEISLKKRKQSS